VVEQNPFLDSLIGGAGFPNALTRCRPRDGRVSGSAVIRRLGRAAAVPISFSMDLISQSQAR